MTAIALLPLACLLRNNYLPESAMPAASSCCTHCMLLAPHKYNLYTTRPRGGQACSTLYRLSWVNRCVARHGTKTGQAQDAALSLPVPVSLCSVAMFASSQGIDLLKCIWQDPVPRVGKLGVLYARPGQRVLVDKGGDMQVRPTPLDIRLSSANPG